MSRVAVARAAAMVAVFTIISRILGLAREFVLARAFGTRGDGGAQADAFNTSLFVVNTIAAILLYTLVTLVIPAFEQERRDRDEHSAWRMLWAIGTWVTLGLVALASLMAVWPELVTAPFGLDADRSEQMQQLVRIMAPGLAMQGVSALLTAVLQSQRRFLGPAAVGIAFNLGIILGLAIGGGSVEAAAWGVVAGAAAQILLQLPQLVMVLRGRGGRPALHHPRLRVMGAMAVPVVGASVLQQINGFTDKFFAGTLADGQIAALNYANVAGAAPRTVLLIPLLTPLFPAIAQLVAERRNADTARAFDRAAGVLALVSLPMGAFLMLFPTEVSRVLFGGRQCDIACIGDIADPIRWYALGTWAAFLGYLLNRTLSALNRPQDIMRATVVTVVLTVGLDIVLIGPMGLSGLALATTLGVTVNALMTAWMLRRSLPEVGLRRLAREQSLLAVAAAVGAAAAALIGTVVPGGATETIAATLGGLVAAGAAGALVFVAAARLLAPAVVREGAGAIRSIVRRRNRG